VSPTGNISQICCPFSELNGEDLHLTRSVTTAPGVRTARIFRGRFPSFSAVTLYGSLGGLHKRLCQPFFEEFYFKSCGRKNGGRDLKLEYE